MGSPAAQLAGLGILALSVAALAVPAWDGLHTWEYAAALVALMALVVRAALHRRFAPIVSFGILSIGAATLANGLLGPDAQIIQRAPGAVAIVPRAEAAAFFPAADAAAIATGAAVVSVRRRAGAPMSLGAGGLTYVGATAVEAVPRIAAYLEVHDRQGGRVTITQPTNPAFLSPVVLFTQSIPIGGRNVPADSFAVPALRRSVKIFYFRSGSLPALARAGAAVLFAVDDEAGNPVRGGIAAVPSGREIALGGMRLGATLGTYPALEVASIPAPAALWLGLALLLGGVVPTKLKRHPGRS